jgi:hypothetical protein
MGRGVVGLHAMQPDDDGADCQDEVDDDDEQKPALVYTHAITLYRLCIHVASNLSGDRRSGPVDTTNVKL